MSSELNILINGPTYTKATANALQAQKFDNVEHMFQESIQ